MFYIDNQLSIITNNFDFCCIIGLDDNTYIGYVETNTDKCITETITIMENSFYLILYFLCLN